MLSCWRTETVGGAGRDAGEERETEMMPGRDTDGYNRSSSTNERTQTLKITALL